MPRPTNCGASDASWRGLERTSRFNGATRSQPGTRTEVPTNERDVSNGAIAQSIARVLMERGLTTTVTEPEEVPTIKDYDTVILGSAVYAVTG
jgi:hypothetical protein